jgi:hypothetical protein
LVLEIKARRSMKKTFIIIIALMWMPCISAQKSKIEKFEAEVIRILKADPGNLQVLYRAGIVFYKRKNYKKAIWYWSSPKFIRHKNYHQVKYFQAKAHLALNEVSTAIYVLNLIDKKRLSPKFIERVIKMQERLVKPDVEESLPYTGSYYRWAAQADLKEL